MVKDLSPIFSKRADDLQEAMGVLTRVLDGRGYQSDSGVHGRRGYSGDYRFGLLAATTLLDAKASRIMSKLGPRLLFLHIQSQSETEEEQLEKLLSRVSYREKADACREAVSGHLNRLWQCHGGFSSLTWHKSADDRELALDLVRLANLGTKLRAQLSKEREYQDGNYEYSPGVFEGPDRYRMLLYNLARGNAISEGRSCLALDDINLVSNVTLSTAPEERRRLLSAVLSSERPITTYQSSKAIDCSEPTARKVADEMERLGILEVGGSATSFEIELSSEYGWLRKLYDAV